MTMRHGSNLPSLPLLLALALTGSGIACGFEPPPPEGGGSETTAAGSSSSSGAGVSFTSAMDASETSTEPTASTSSSGSVDSGESFLSLPDGGDCFMVSTPDGFEPRCTFSCDVAVPGHCPRGEKCMPWSNDGGPSWNTTRCSPVAEDPAGVGEPCVAEGSPVSGLDTCDASSMCFGVDPSTLQGTCAPLCNPEAGVSCADDEVCAVYDSFAPQVCMPRCDPLDPAACAAGETCRQIEGDTLCIPDVVLPQGAPCGANDQYCAEGEVCQVAEVLASCDDEACCRPWCDLSAPDPELPCSAVPGEVCRPFSDPPPAGLEHVGACGLPL